jgi:predicted dehydrogenase
MAIIQASLEARKHVLSQKPFAIDLDLGKRLVDLADSRQVYLAVNQNARWAPHYRWMHSAIRANLIGSVFAIHLQCHWDHTWVRGTAFEQIRHLVLYDYAIHWFDLLRYFLGQAMPSSLYATTARAPQQDLAPNLLAQVALQFESAQATLVFDAAVKHGQMDHSYIGGTQGSLFSSGPSILSQQVQLNLPSGSWSPKLDGCWFPDGFAGTMGELLCAIEQRREPTNSARDNLNSLAICFAALASADSGLPVRPGSITRIPD